jgi:hypothetical protein
LPYREPRRGEILTDTSNPCRAPHSWPRNIEIVIEIVIEIAIESLRDCFDLDTDGDSDFDDYNSAV